MKLRLPSTLSVLMSLAAAAGCWEMWTIANRQNGDTFSAVTKKLGENQPVIILGCGLLCGHLWRDRIAIFLTGLAIGMRDWPLLDKEDIEEK